MVMAQTAFRTRPAFNRHSMASVRRTQRAEMPLFQAFLRPSSAKVTDGLCIKDATTIDPACGSGNFLTETYLSIRKLENEILREKIDAKKGQTAGQIVFGDLGNENNPIQVSIQQFYGIEINDFAVTVAKTALWIAESQMMKQTEDVIHTNLDFLPLTTNAHIIEGNALRLDWTQLHEEKRTPMVYAEIANLIRPDPMVLGEPTFHFDEVDLVTPNLHVGKPDVEIKPISYDYIMGNPPFVGARLMSKEQKQDVKDMFDGWKNVGNLDYVSCWYKKASEVVRGTSTRCALVSTNSVAQGEAVANLWKPLMENGVHIDFAHRTFRWDSEAHIKAHVHCVIIGFSVAENQQKKKIFNGENVELAANINGYLIDAENIFVESRNKALCDVPEIGIGNKPIDGGYYLFTEEERDEFVQKEPSSATHFRLWYGSKEFINRSPRYCLYLANCTPAELRAMPECMKRIKAVKEFRLASSSAGTRKLAETPLKFHVTNMPEGTFIVVPKTSSEHRRYIPMGFMSPENLCSDAVFLIPNATLYHFGVLESNVHMAWMRAVAGRLEMRYRYSKDIVYNNFPWCTPTDKQRQAIEQTAQEILDARNLYPDSSLADLYDPLTMPPELLKAHNRNNAAVMKAYGFSTDMSETECVAELMKMYQKLVKEKADE